MTEGIGKEQSVRGRKLCADSAMEGAEAEVAWDQIGNFACEGVGKQARVKSSLCEFLEGSPRHQSVLVPWLQRGYGIRARSLP